MMNEVQVEEAIVSAGLTAPRITPNQIDSKIASIAYWQPEGTTLSVCALTLKNGTCVTGESACVSPENFSIEIGKDIAFRNAREKIWALEGYLLKEKLTFGVERIAKVAHEVNRAYCAASGDDSQASWDKAPDWLKECAVDSVKNHLNIEMTPRESHEAWVKHKLAAGWSWGMTKDYNTLNHPCLIPYDSLPLTQRIKDYLFGAIVRAMK